MRAALVALALAACSKGGEPAASPGGSGSVPVRTTPDKPVTLKVTPPGPTAFDPTHTYAVVLGVLHWKDTSFATFSPADRKDRELFELLGKRGVPAAQRVLLLDEEATTDKALAAIDKLVAAAPEHSTFLFYYAGHGGPVSNDDVALATYDAIGDEFGTTGLTVSAITSHLSPFKGELAILLGDACYTGGLQAAARALGAKDIKAVALTSASAANTSTANWTYTQTIIDGLSGRAILDTNGDGTIGLDELATDVGDAMASRENQRHGYGNYGVDPKLVVAKVTPDAAKLERSIAGIDRGTWVRAKSPVTESVEPARVLGARGGKVVVAFYDYATETVRDLAPADVEPFAAHLAETIQVEWKGKWYAATVTSKKADLTCIHYIGYDATWDECVTAARIR